MKQSTRTTAVALIVAILGWQAPAVVAEGRAEDQQASATGAAPEAESLLYMREEEKLARDVYLVLNQTWGNPVFGNIAASEQQHMDAILVLLQARQMEDPVADLAPGEFSNPQLADLYAELVEIGTRSLPDAMRVGATIEDLDIADLEAALTEHPAADIQQTLGRLRDASENHLSAFLRQLSRLGETYEAQFMDEQQFAEISIRATGGPGTAGRPGRR